MKTRSLRGRDFISTLEFTKDELESMLELAAVLKADNASGREHLLLLRKTLFIIFYNKSLRARNSFETGMTQLGGHANYLDSEKIYTPATEGEEKAYSTERVSDVARVLARMSDGIAIRMYGKPTGWKYGNGNKYLREFAKWADIPLDPMMIDAIKENSKKYGGSFEETDSMEDAFKDADVLYPKSWGSLTCVPPQTSEINVDKMKALFDKNKDWICDDRKLKLAKPEAIYMHCLPCDRGYEVTDSVIDGPNSVVFDEAENRLHAQKGIMALLMR